MNFRLVPKSVALNDLERRNGLQPPGYRWAMIGGQIVRLSLRQLR